MIFYKLSHHKGFTLVEVVIALLIITAAVITLSASWSGNLMKYNKSKRHDIAVYLLEKKMTELLAEYEGKPLESVKEEDSGDFGTDYKNFRWEFKSQELLLPDMKSLTATKDDGNDAQSDQITDVIVNQMQSFMEKSIKEIQLSVFVKVDKDRRAKKGRSEAKYTLSTYIVDFNQELDLQSAAAALGNLGGESE